MIQASRVAVVARALTSERVNLSFKRRAAAVAKVLIAVEDLRVEDGEMLAIVGPNGAGKSTLLGALSGDRALSTGSVHINGNCLHAQSWFARAQVRAVLPQRAALTAAFTASEVVELASPRIGRTQALHYLDEVGLAAFADRRYPTLSGGEQQRVQFARVLAQLSLHPRAALLLDEPTAALDLGQQQIIMRLAERAARQGRAVVVVVHDLTLAAQRCDRVALLANGRVVSIGAAVDTLTTTQLASAYGGAFEILQGRRGPVISCISE